jgi:tetrahydromethanopterin S-methyltransferase subunit A
LQGSFPYLANVGKEKVALFRFVIEIYAVLFLFTIEKLYMAIILLQVVHHFD